MNIATRLKVGAEILLSITVIIMIIVATKVISLGEPIGLQLLLSTAFFVMFMWLGWLHPKPTGMGLAAIGLIAVVFLGRWASDPTSWRLFGSPILIAGLLFFGAGSEHFQTT